MEALGIIMAIIIVVVVIIILNRKPKRYSVCRVVIDDVYNLNVELKARNMDATDVINIIENGNCIIVYFRRKEGK